MAVPVISDNTWQRTKGLTKIAVASESIDVESISFSDKVEILLNTQPVEEYKDMDFDSYTYSHSFWDEGKTFTVKVDPDRDHRPRFPSDTLERLDRWVNELPTSPPADTLSIEDKVSLLNEKVERYFKALDCYIKVRADLESIEDEA